MPNPVRELARAVGSATLTLAAIKHVDKTEPLDAAEGIVLRYGGFYGPGASEVLVDAVRKRQVPVIGGGTGIWSFIEITDAAAVWLGRLLAGEFVVGLARGVPRYREAARWAIADFRLAAWFL
jgi:hypothetical protein